MTDVLIPEESLLQHIAFLGKTGAGKTTAAKGRIEDLIRAGRRCCIVDPTGVWWGLRLAPDGIKPGLPVVIFGGKRGDVPIADKDGAKVAGLVAAGSFSSVIDTKGMTVAARTRFFTDFAQALFQKNERPLHLVLDEAHVFAPQGKVPNPAAGMMLHATNELVSGGRSQGLRIMLLSQRPAKLHKDSLTQVETLVMMRLIAPQDRKAVMEWVGEWADAAQGREINAALPSLKRGAAYVWSPEVGFLELVVFPPATTFDSSRAPVDGDEDRKAPTLAELPLDDIRAAFEAPPPPEPAKPPEGMVTGAAMKMAVAKASEVMFAEGKRVGSLEGHAEGMKVGISQALGELRPIIARLEAMAYGSEPDHVPDASKVVAFPSSAAPDLIKGEVEPKPRRRFEVLASALNVPTVRTPAQSGGYSPTPPQQRILDALAWAEALLETKALDRSIVAWLADASPKASGFQNNLGAMRTGGLIEYPSPGLVMLTDEGGACANHPETPPTLAALLEAILARLPRPQAAILTVVVEAHPRTLSRGMIADLVGKSASASGFQNDLGRLRTLKLLTYPSPGTVQAAAYLVGNPAGN